MKQAKAALHVERAYVVGRNGYFDLSQIRIAQFGDNVSIVGVSKKTETELNAGFGLLTETEMDTLAVQWLESRGYKLRFIGIEPYHYIIQQYTRDIG